MCHPVYAPNDKEKRMVMSSEQIHSYEGYEAKELDEPTPPRKQYLLVDIPDNNK